MKQQVLKLLCSVFLLISQSQVDAKIGLGVSQTSLKLSQNSNFTFKIQTETKMDKSSHFILNLESKDRSLTIPNALSECQTIEGFSVETVPCIKLSSTQIRIGCFQCEEDNSLSQYQISIAGLTNPAGATDLRVTVQTYSEDNELLDQSDVQVITYASGTLQSVEMVPKSFKVGDIAPLVFTMRTESPVPKDGKIEVLLPKLLTIDQGAPKDYEMVVTDELVDCSVSFDAGVIKDNSDGVAVQCEIVQGSLVITQAFTQTSTSVASGTQIKVEITNVRYPLSLKPLTGIQVSTMDVFGNYIDRSDSLTLTMTQVAKPVSIGQSKVLLKEDTAPARLGTYVLTFVPTLPIPSQGSFSLTLPEQIAFMSSDINDIEISDTTFPSDSWQVKFGQQPNELIFTELGFIQESTPLTLTIRYLKNPANQDETSSFTFSTLDQDGFPIETLDHSLTVECNVSLLQSVVFNPQEDQRGVYQTSSTFDLSFTLANPFEADMRLVFEFQGANSAETSSYLVTSVQECTIIAQEFEVNEGSRCEVDPVNKRVTMTNLTDQILKQETQINLQVSQMRVRNPGSTRDQSIVYVYTANADKVIDVGLSQKFSPRPSPFLKASVSPSSLVTTESNVDYFFMIQPNGPIPQYASIKVVLPPQIRVSDTEAILTECSDLPVAGVPLNPTDDKNEFKCVLQENKSAIQIVDLFAHGSTSYYQAISFTLPGLQNPRLVGQPTESLQIFIYEDDEMLYQVYAMVENIFVTMDEANRFGRTIITQDSKANKAVNIYRFNISKVPEAQSRDTLIIGFPQSIKLGPNVECQGLLDSLNGSQSCQTDEELNQVSITIALANGNRSVQNLYISVSDVTNSGTTAPSDPFSLRLESPDRFTIGENLQAGRITNSSPFILPRSAFKVEPNVLDLGAQTSYKITYRPETYVAGMRMEIKLPFELSFVDIFQIKCAGLNENVDQAISCEYDSLKDTVLITKAFTTIDYNEDLGIQFALATINNPRSLLTTSSFSVTTFSQDGYLVDSRTTDLVLSFGCLEPCQLCVQGSNNICSVCHKPGDPFFTDKAFLYNGLCIETCPDSLGTFDSLDLVSGESQTICVKCHDSDCASCSGEAKGQCIECADPDTMKLVDGECIEQASIYWFPFLCSIILWLLVSLVLTRVRLGRQVYFLPLAIPGVQLVSFAMALFDSFTLYPSKEANELANATISMALGVPTIIQIGFLVFLLPKLLRDEDVRAYLRRQKYNKHAFITLVVLSCLTNYRTFKVIYSNLRQPTLDLTPMRDQSTKPGWRPYRLNMLLSLSMVLSDLALCAIAISLLTWPDADQRLMYSGIERIICSLILASLTIVEFMPQRFCKGISNKIKSYQVLATSQNVSTTSMLTDSNINDLGARSFVMQLKESEANDEAVNNIQISIDQNKIRKQHELYFERNGQKLKRSKSFCDSTGEQKDKDTQQSSLCRFILKQTENQTDQDDRGYLSDPTPIANVCERVKLYNLAPNLSQEFKVPLRQKTQKLELKSLQKYECINWTESQQISARSSTVPDLMHVSPADFNLQNQRFSDRSHCDSQEQYAADDIEPQKCIESIITDDENDDVLQKYADDKIKSQNNPYDEKVSMNVHSGRLTEELKGILKASKKRKISRNGYGVNNELNDLSDQSTQLIYQTNQSMLDLHITPKSSKSSSNQPKKAFNSRDLSQKSMKSNKVYDHKGMKIPNLGRNSQRTLNKTGHMVDGNRSGSVDRILQGNNLRTASLEGLTQRGNHPLMSMRTHIRREKPQPSSRLKLNGSHILYNASYKPKYYGVAHFIEKAEVKQINRDNNFDDVSKDQL